MYTVITILVLFLALFFLVGLVGGVVALALLVIDLAKKDKHFLGLSPENGKLVRKREDVVNIFFNSKNNGHYQKDGALVAGRQNLGVLFKLIGCIFYGIYPIWNVLNFDLSWSEYAGAVVDENGVQKQPPRAVPQKKPGCNSFTRLYTHAIAVHGAEMKHEGTGKDTAVTRIDLVMLVTIEIYNIIDALFKISPEGIVFTQVDTAVKASVNDYIRTKIWETFKDEDKGDQNSDFVKYILNHSNPVLDALGIGMRVKVVELRYHDLSDSPENRELAASQTLGLIAQNKGEAEKTLAGLEKDAAELRGQGAAAALAAVKAVIGTENIGTYAALEQVKDTQLRVYGAATTPVISADGETTGGDKS